MRIRSSSPNTLSLAPLPPTPPPSATSPVSPIDTKREPTPFDELPMSHLISFPMMDSPTSSDHVDGPHPYESFHNMQQSYPSYQSSTSLLRDAFDYYRLSTTNPSSAHDAFNMSIHGQALKPQLHAHTIPDLTNSLSYVPPTHLQQQEQLQQECIPPSHLFPSAAPAPVLPVKASSPTEDDEGSPPPGPSSSQSQSQSNKKRPPRATISTKDFIPPDVSGLSKREARLVKNRAAAFLSRQRKREEFELMEIRVAQLEQENARLLALTQSSSSSSSSRPSSPPHPAQTGSAEAADMDVASLRSLLTQSRARAAELEEELTRLRISGSASSSSDTGSDAGSPGAPIQVKRENMGADSLPGKRTGAGLFGVVLLCALPTLLSLPAPSVPFAASRFTFTPGVGASLHRSQSESLLDWTGMDVDDGAGSRRKANLPLSFLNGQSSASELLHGLTSVTGSDLSSFPSELDSSTEAEFEISFVPSATEGKIRVRIETPSESNMLRGSSPSSSLGSGSPALGYTQSSSSDGWDLDFTAPEHSQGMMWDTPSAGANVDMSMSLFASQPVSSRRRVRIALKNGPVAGAEGGEWEVEVQ